MPHFLLIPIGSAGDVHPLVGLGTVLKARGHRVTIVTNPKFEPLTRRMGLEFEPLGTIDEFDAVTADPKLWSTREGFKLIARWGMLNTLRPMYETIEKHYQAGETVVVAPTMALGSRIAHEKLGVPLSTIALQPSVYRSVYQSAHLPPMLMGDWVPKLLKRLQFYAADRMILDPAVALETNVFRAELELPPVQRLLDHWWFSPQQTLALFPDWFAAPQKDWPAGTLMADFPLWDPDTDEKTSDELDAFLTDGDPPIVFSPGSAMEHGHEFFEVAANACKMLGHRGVLLTRSAHQIPTDLPIGVRHFEYARFGDVLPRSAALVHHGGIGSTSQALQAGIPQLIVPMAYDQPDNALRLKKLGVGSYLTPRNFQIPAVAYALRRLLGTSEVATRCKALAENFANPQGLQSAATAVESLIGRDLSN